MTGSKRLAAQSYRSSSDREPVCEWLKDLADTDRRAIGKAIATVEYSWPVGMPLCRPMKGGLFEVRCSLADNRISRVLFCTVQNQMILLHAFIKKTPQTPPRELDLAMSRMKEVLNHEQ